MTDLPFGMTDAESYRVIAEATRAMTSYQAVTTEEAWTALTGYSADDLDDEERRAVEWVLTELGYLYLWTSCIFRRDRARRWVRERWKFDLCPDRYTPNAYTIFRGY